MCEGDPASSGPHLKASGCCSHTSANALNCLVLPVKAGVGDAYVEDT